MADFVDIMHAQRADARNQFGAFKSAERGQSNVDVPNVDGRFAMRVRSHWRGEAQRLREHVKAIPDSAIVSQWTRAVDRMNDAESHPVGPFGSLVPLPKPTALNKAIDERASIGPGALLTSAQAQEFWDLVSAVALPMRGIRETPTSWEIAAEAIKEAVDEAFDVGFDTLKIVLGVAGAALVLWAMGD